MEKRKNSAIIGIFAALLLGISLLQLLLPDKSVSAAERRKLAQAPIVSAQGLVSGEFGKALEAYLLDQFPARQTLRGVKALTQLFVFGQRDSNGLYLTDGSAVKMEYPLDEAQVQFAADKLQCVARELLGESRIYYAVVPDKNYYAAEKTGHLQLDYARLDELLAATLPGEKIELYDLLTLDDYYATDAHWRQECIVPVAERLAQQMDAAQGFVPQTAYRIEEYTPFFGVYSGQTALPLPADTLRLLRSEQTDTAVVTGAEFEGTRQVYETALLQNTDSYDVFLCGAQAVLTVTLPDAQTDKELLIFRDSFGSSLAPLLLGAYKKITLIDLRYVAAALLPELVEFHGQDALFLLSTSVYNSGRLLK